jgi:hypothetical protein
MATVLDRQHAAVLLPVLGETSRELDDRHRRQAPDVTDGKAVVRRLHTIARSAARKLTEAGRADLAERFTIEADAYDAAFVALTGERIR